MSPSPENPHTALTRAFHEPNRLQILSALATAPQGLTFRELKDRCQLTDGNLSRHLKTLEDAQIVRIQKAFVDLKPCTTLYLSDEGRQSFIDYIESLEKVLQQAKAATRPGAGPAQEPSPKEQTGS